MNRLSTEEDTALIERVLAGDSGVFEVLMERYAPMVLGYLCRRTRSNLDKEDLLQEIFFTAYSQLENLRRLDRFGPWLMKIVRNKCVDFLRKRTVQPPTVSIEDYSDTISSDVFSQRVQLLPDPIEEASFAETRSLVLDAIGKTGDKHRTILYMRLIGEEPLYEIAQRLGLKESTVRVRLHRGLKTLRNFLKDIDPTGS